MMKIKKPPTYNPAMNRPMEILKVDETSETVYARSKICHNGKFYYRSKRILTNNGIYYWHIKQDDRGVYHGAGAKYSKVLEHQYQHLLNKMAIKFFT